jgi:hypothetical protein
MRLCSGSGALALLTLATCAACASGPTPKNEEAPSPQAYIEQQLIARGSRGNNELNTRTSDGGMLYHADFNAANASTLRVPFDLLKKYCEDKGGHWVPSGHARTSAASLATSRAPNELASILAGADQRGMFGKFRCESSGPVWTASIEPSAFTPTDTSEAWRLQVFVKAIIGSDLSVGDEWPVAAPPPLAAGSAAPPVPPAPPAAAESISLSPGTQPVVSQQSSPLSAQPLGPAAQSDRLLADPRPFGINLGSDAPDVFASKLRLEAGKPCGKPGTKPAKSTPKQASGPGRAAAELCWEQPGASEATALRASFAELGMGPVVAEFEVRYPAAAFAWLERAMLNDWGAADPAAESPTSHSWTWQHTTITLSHLDAEATHDTIVRAQHKPTLDRMHLPASAPGRAQTGPMRTATPWQLQLGYEPAELAQAKLQAVGFSIAKGSCSDGGLHARPILTRSCRLQGGKMDGLRDATVDIVDPGDGRPRLAQLAYTFDKRVLDETVKELRTQYGEPIPGTAGALEWWTGPVGIAIVPAGDAFSLRYFHGRLLQYSYNARDKNQAADKALQRQGL